jgi:hypothetical protein
MWVLAAVRYGIVAAFAIESYIFRAAHYWDDPKDDLLRTHSGTSLLVVSLACSISQSRQMMRANSVTRRRSRLVHPRGGAAARSRSSRSAGRPSDGACVSWRKT